MFLSFYLSLLIKVLTTKATIKEIVKGLLIILIKRKVANNETINQITKPTIEFTLT